MKERTNVEGIAWEGRTQVEPPNAVPHLPVDATPHER